MFLGLDQSILDEEVSTISSDPEISVQPNIHDAEDWSARYSDEYIDFDEYAEYEAH